MEAAGPVAADDASRQPRYVSGQYFFEYLVVVSLQKAKGSSNYEPQITYQFPKVSVVVDTHAHTHTFYKGGRKELCALFDTNSFIFSFIQALCVKRVCVSVLTERWDG